MLLNTLIELLQGMEEKTEKSERVLDELLSNPEVRTKLENLLDFIGTTLKPESADAMDFGEPEDGTVCLIFISELSEEDGEDLWESVYDQYEILPEEAKSLISIGISFTG